MAKKEKKIKNSKAPEPKKAEPKKKVEYAQGIFPKRPLQPGEFNANGMTFDKGLLVMPDFVKKLPTEQQQALVMSPTDDIIRGKPGRWNGEGINGGRPLTGKERGEAATWSGNWHELALWVQEHPTAWETVQNVLGTSAPIVGALAGFALGGGPAGAKLGLALGSLAGGALQAIPKSKNKELQQVAAANMPAHLTKAAGLESELGGGGAGAGVEGGLNSLQTIEEVERLNAPQKEAARDLLQESIQSMKQLHAEGRQPIPVWNKIPWEAIGQFAKAPLDYYAAKSALGEKFAEGEIPNLTASLRGLGAPVRSSAYQNALERAGQNYNDRLWALRSAAAGQALGALGSLGTHFGNLENMRQQRFQQLGNLTIPGVAQGLNPQTQVLMRGLQEPPAPEPTSGQRVAGIFEKALPAIINTGGELIKTYANK